MEQAGTFLRDVSGETESSGLDLPFDVERLLAAMYSARVYASPAARRDTIQACACKLPQLDLSEDAVSARACWYAWTASIYALQAGGFADPPRIYGINGAERVRAQILAASDEVMASIIEDMQAAGAEPQTVVQLDRTYVLLMAAIDVIDRLDQVLAEPNPYGRAVLAGEVAAAAVELLTQDVDPTDPEGISEQWAHCPDRDAARARIMVLLITACEVRA